jgi:hypothetical protein
VGERCERANTTYYVAALGSPTITLMTVMAKSPEYMFDGSYTVFSSSSLVKISGDYLFKNFTRLYTITIERKRISVYKNGVEFFYEWEEDQIPPLITAAVPSILPRSPIAALIFDERLLPSSTIKKIIQTIKFIR